MACHIKRANQWTISYFPQTGQWLAQAIRIILMCGRGALILLVAIKSAFGMLPI